MPNVSLMSAQYHEAARVLSEQTGGLTFWYTDAGKALSAISAATRADYLIGYVPTNTLWKGEYRQIGVTVDRPGAAVLFRHGYHATTALPTWDDRATMTELRMAEARAAARLPRELNLTLETHLGKSAPGQPRVDVDVAIEPSAIQFTTEGGRHVATLDIALWLTDAKGMTVGSLAETIHLRLGDASFGKLVRQNIDYTAHVAVTGAARDVKAVVYDYDADRVGAATARVLR